MRIEDPKKVDLYYQALVERNSQFVGVFYVGVKTTSIFCISTYHARKPKKENTEYFSDFKGALAAGYRPCKVCKPTENTHEMPTSVKQAIDLLQSAEEHRVTDGDLRSKGISPSLVRRWFNNHYGMTFQAFQRMQRVNTAMKSLETGNSALETAFESGYQSISGFGYTFKKITGKAPSETNRNSVILIHRFTTPLGPMFVCATKVGVCLLEFVDRRALETEFGDLQKRLHATIIAGENQHTKQAEMEVKEYFEGKRQAFTITLHTPGTPFQQSVWNLLTTIPYSETRSYQQQAEAINKPKAVRAVASANGHNRIAIVIPCHRVIGKNGNLTGYAGGLERKRWLLDHEQKHARPVRKL